MNKGRVLLQKSNAQAALETLMTYGWALLAVVVAIGALSYFGVLDAEKFLPSKCIITEGLTCMDYIVDSSVVTLVLLNSVGETITISKVTVGDNYAEPSCTNPDQTVMKNGEMAKVVVVSCQNGASGKKFAGHINISYTKASTGLLRQATGALISRVASDILYSSNSVCQNAEDQSICEGLDVVFGSGYRNACCQEHSLCCP